MEVTVRDDNIEYAIKSLKKLVAIDGILFDLKMRDLYPAKGDRQRAKVRRAVQRKIKAGRRQRWREARR